MKSSKPIKILQQDKLITNKYLAYNFFEEGIHETFQRQ